MLDYNELKTKVLDLPISTIIESRRGKTRTINGRETEPWNGRVCPFHELNFADEPRKYYHRAGSFHYTDGLNIFKCFACDEKGDAIDFVREFDGVGFIEAILRIAYENALIDKETYEENSKDIIQTEVTVKPARVVNKICQSQKKTVEHLDKVYRELINLCGLDEIHHDYLVNERHLSEREIKENMYFSLKPIDIQELIVNIEKYSFSKFDLLGVPGFYFEDGQFHMADIEGVGIPLFDPAGKIQAIQCRLDNVEKGGSRYIFLSSSRYNFGCTCGAVVGTVRPVNPRRSDVFITEGQFKANKLAQLFGAVALTIQGVNNIKNLDDDIPRIVNRSDARVIICFDADIVTNPQVKKACRKLSAKIHKLCDNPVHYVYWDEELGKGIDDVINNGHIKQVQLMSEEEFYKKLG